MSADRSEPTIDVVARGDAAENVAEEAESRMRRVIDLVGAPVLYGELKLGVATDGGAVRPALAQAMLDIDGQPVRAQVASETMPQAVAALEARLRDQVQHRAERLRARARGRVAPGEDIWHRDRPMTDRPPWFERPAEDREVVRRKSFSLDPATLDEAAFDLEMLDHDFHLFREASTGADAVLVREDDGSYRMRRIGDPDAPIEATTVRVAVEPAPAPELSFDEATDWLELADEPFVLFRDRANGTGTILYRRYDGHYGVITAA